MTYHTDDHNEVDAILDKARELASYARRAQVRITDPRIQDCVGHFADHLVDITGDHLTGGAKSLLSQYQENGELGQGDIP